MGFLIMRILLSLLLVCFSTPAIGMVYTWKDSSGVAHYTNKDYEIPARYRAKAKALYPDQADTSPPQQNAQTQPSQVAKPVEQPTMPQQPVIVPQPPKIAPEVPARRSRRNRGTSSSEE